MKVYRYLLFSSILLIFFNVSGCSDKPEGLLSKKKFSNILAEFIYIENMAVSNDQKQSLIRKTLATYNITIREFKKTKEYYKENAQFWLKVYKRAQEKIKNRETALQRLGPSQKQAPKESDIVSPDKKPKN